MGVQLDKACNEIRELSAIKRELEKRIQEDAKEKAHLEENLKMQFHKVDALQRDICSVREVKKKSWEKPE